MLNTTLCILIKKEGEEITDILLAMKKRGFGTGWWNGLGGKVNNGEGIDEAARREVFEEINVQIKDLEKVAEIDFSFPNQKNWDQVMHVYFSRSWLGQPRESEEMRPQWFKMADIPYHVMWPGDEHWLPKVFSGKKIKGGFVFAENHKLVDYKVTIVDKV